MSNSPSLEEGDLAQLVSGGPVMSVQMLSADRAMCMWFDQEGKLHEKAFPFSLLVKVERKDDVA